MVTRSRLPKENKRGIGSKIMGGLGTLGKAYWDSIPTTNEPKMDNAQRKVEVKKPSPTENSSGS